VVTGAGSGIGLALAGRFARAGLKVVLADVEEPALRAASERMEGIGAKALAVPTDVSDEVAVQALAAAAVDRFGAVHVMCNNAGVATLADPWFGPLTTWTWVFGVNLWGIICGIRAFLPILAAQGEGQIVNTAGGAGIVPAPVPSTTGASMPWWPSPKTCTPLWRSPASPSERVSCVPAFAHPDRRCRSKLAGSPRRRTPGISGSRGDQPVRSSCH
jgi:NAD(P)-dependent dehydrogenase (short-subunit alcohol dehydrogenase family)